MNSRSADPEGVAGVAEAIRHYGEPVRRDYRYQLSEDAWRYWESVRPKRTSEVVLLLRRPQGQFVVHSKSFYPPGVYRLLSGGIKRGEDLIAAVLREAHEETGLQVTVDRFLALAEHCFVWQDKSMVLASYLFVLSERGGVLGSQDPGESISDFREVSLAELAKIAESLEALPPAWNDWGRFRASMHRLAVELLSGGQDER